MVCNLVSDLQSLVPEVQCLNCRNEYQLPHPKIFPRLPPVFFLFGHEAGEEHSPTLDKGSPSPFVNGRASLSPPSLLSTPRHLISEPKFSLFDRGMPPDSEWMNALPCSALVQLLGWDSGRGRFGLAASAGI